MYFKDTPEGLKAIADGKVDTLLISNFRYNNIASLCQKYNLVTLSTGVEMDYCFAVDRGNTTLYSILSRVANLVPAASVNSALSSNSGIQLRMGVMPWQKDTPPQQLLEGALIACNLARGYFKDHLVIFDDKAREREALEHRLEGDLRRAIDNREFEVHYQPKYDIQTEPPTLKSAEALVRWRHPELGMIPPGDFIPLFERNGQINLLDKYVWEEAARQIAAWREKYGVTVPVSVNLSRVDVFDPELESTLEALIKKNGLEYGDLKLEVTESACTENPYQVIDVIERLRKKGFEIEMDDFGSGYSSLNMLSTMPIDVLKMDRMFIGNIKHNAKDIQLVELILGIARNLKVPVIAEGVETEAQLKLLKEMGCELVQGFYFSRPLPASEFERHMVTGGSQRLASF